MTFTQKVRFNPYGKVVLFHHRTNMVQSVKVFQHAV
jgi:hypothetical protein